MKVNRRTLIAMAAAFITGAVPPIQQMVAESQFDMRLVSAVLIGAFLSGLVGATNKLVEYELGQDK